MKKNLIIRVANTAVSLYVLAHVFGLFFLSRAGLCILLWILACLGWFMPVAYVGHYFDPGVDHLGVLLSIIGILAFFTVPIMLRAGETASTVQPDQRQE